MWRSHPLYVYVQVTLKQVYIGIRLLFFNLDNVYS